MPAPQAKLDAARRYLDADEPALAREVLLPLVARHGGELLPTAMLVEALIQSGALAQAEFYFERLPARFPDEPDTWTVATQLRVAQKRLDEAEAAARRAIELDPRGGMRYRNLAIVHYAQENELAMAEAARLGALADPGDPDLRLKHATGLLSIGRSEESCELFRSAVADFPEDRPLAEGYAVALNYAPGVPLPELRAAHERFGRLLAGAFPVDASLASRAGRVVGRPPRVGILSPDLRRHSVAFFVEAIFRHHDRASFELFVYSTATKEDDVSAMLKGLLAPGRWRGGCGLPPRGLAGLIARDGLDVLVDLGGLFFNHSQAALALRPAARIATHIGYPATTGVPTVDARLVDTLTDPPGLGEAAMTERPVRLDPCFLCYTPPATVPEITWAPPGAGGVARPVVFGSFNMLSKINGATLAAWSAVLARVPGARLRLKAKGLNHPSVRADVLSRAATAGIDPARVDIEPTTPGLSEHLDQYNRIDIALDTFPYHGTTTTCEALLMGVPVVTLAGDRHAARVGVSLLTAVGRPDLITGDVGGYVDRAVNLVGEITAAGVAGRIELRRSVLGSDLTDGNAYTRRWSEAILGLLDG